MNGIEHLLGSLEPLIREHGAVAVLVIITLESFGVPLPGESLLLLASGLAARGELSTPAVAAAAFAGAVLGDNIGYAIGRYAGRTLLLRHGDKIGLTAERLDQVEAAFHRFGPPAVAFARFVAVLRQLNGVVAGTLAMPWWRFLPFNAIGAALWVGVWLTVGHEVGAHVEALTRLAVRFWPGLLAVALVAVAAVVLWRRRRAEQRPGE